ncbi:MAG: arginine--tRNA ligase [Flavobacteriales bacterium]|nr:arginine--tRNA ligase [Crocinitomicaceae bacterium]NBX80077.1 arginine--tRNA ligase [Flavobacteriales bacterium]
MEEKIKKIVLDNALELFGAGVEENLIQFQQTRKDVEGDLTLVVFPFVKLLKCSPIQAGEKIGAFLKNNVSEIEKYAVINGFLNLVFSNDYWLNQLDTIYKTQNFGFSQPGSKPMMMVEYSSPNTNKPLHLGHLRNNFLGYSVSEILKANGHEVVKTQVINDRGIHICKSMLAWEKFSPLNEKGERETPANTGLKGDKLVGKYYVEFDKHFNQEAKEIIEQWQLGDFSNFSNDTKIAFVNFEKAKEGKDEKAIQGIDDKIKDLAKNQTALLRDAKEMLVKWEARDPQVYLLWTTMNSWVYEGFEVTYKKMGVDFDKLYYESETFLLGKDQVIKGLEQGVFFRKDDGSVWIDLTSDGLDEKIVLRSDGTAVYITQDIGTAIDRFSDFPNLNGMVYTVGNEQDYHFKVLFLILKKLGYTWAENCFHLSYGMVDLPTGKMKSREGTVVDADDLIDEVVETAAEMTKERGHLEGMTEDEREKLYYQIGLGGLKYYLLKVDPKKRMMFNPEESIDLTGNTGPFIQYTHARICSLIAKAGELNFKATNVELLSEEIEIIKQLALYPEIINEAATTFSPAVIANYTYELVKTYNHFYQSVKINIEPNETIKMNRLKISSEVAKTIEKSLKLLGIFAPQKM